MATAPRGGSSNPGARSALTRVAPAARPGCGQAGQLHAGGDPNRRWPPRPRDGRALQGRAMSRGPVRLKGLALAVAALVATAANAGAHGTLLYPADGATVTLDRGLDCTFRW